MFTSDSVRVPNQKYHLHTVYECEIVPVYTVYNQCTSTVQYTVRYIPVPVSIIYACI